MSDADLTDLCRKIVAEHADRVAANGADPLAIVGGLDAYAEAIQDLSANIADEVKDESPR
jgi:hypothetical protein